MRLTTLTVLVVTTALLVTSAFGGRTMTWNEPFIFSLDDYTQTSVTVSRDLVYRNGCCGWWYAKYIITRRLGGGIPIEVNAWQNSPYTHSGLTPGTRYTITFAVDAESSSPGSWPHDFDTHCPVGYGIVGPLDGCQQCPSGTYSDNGDSSTCTPCPHANAATPLGSTSASACVCRKGFFGTATLGACSICPADTYKENIGDAVQCDQCQAPATTNGVQGSETRDACLCPPGAEPYTTPEGRPGCSPCPVNTYSASLSTDACEACPIPALTVGPGGNSTESCLCPSGYEGDASACALCDEGTFKSSLGPGPCVPCTNPGATTPGPGAVSNAECSLCLPEFWGDSCNACPDSPACAFACDDTKAGTGACFCAAGTGYLLPGCTECSTSWFGAGCDQVCTCNQERGICDSGPTGSGQCSSCFTGYAGPNCGSCALGHTPSSDCALCQEGWERIPPAACSQCLPGTFKAAADTGTVCTRCAPGSYQPGTGQTSCLPCPEGTYMDDEGAVAECKPCGLGLSSAQGASSSDQCFPCGPNSYKNVEGEGTCSPCPGATSTLPDVEGADTIDVCGCLPGTGWDPAETCVACNASMGETSPLLERAPCFPCPRGTTYGGSDAACISCPFGAVCEGRLAVPYASPGFYPAGPFAYVACAPASVCLGRGSCLPGHTGFRCAVCAPGHFKDANSGLCKVCPDNVQYIFLGLFVLAAIGCVILVRVARSAHGYFTAASIGFSFLQIVSVLSSFSDLKWPPAVSTFLQILSAVNTDLSLFRPECLVTNTAEAYEIIWAIKLASPGVMIFIFVASWSCVWIYSRATLALSKSKPDSLVFGCIRPMTAARRRSWKYAFVNATVTMLFLLYLLVCNTAMEIYPCNKQVDGSYSMAREPSILCYESLWFRLMTGSIVVLVLFSLAMPLTIGYILFSRRENLWKRKNQAKYGPLFARFRPTFFLWELSVLVRKFGVIFGKVVFSYSVVGQVMFAWVVILFSFLAQIRWAPYSTFRINRLETVMLIMAQIVLSLAVAFAVANGKMSYPAEVALGTALIAMVVIACIILGIAIFLEFRKTYRLKKRGLVGRFAIDKVDASSAFFGAKLGIALTNHVQTESTISLTFTSQMDVSMAAQVALEKKFVNKRDLEARSWCDYFSWCRASGWSDTTEFHPVFQCETPVGKNHALTISCPDTGYYSLTILVISDDANLTAWVPPATGVWGRFVRFVDGSGFTVPYCPEFVRTAMTRDSQRLITMRLISSPEWTASDSIAGNVMAIDATSFTTPSADMDQRMVEMQTFGVIDDDAMGVGGGGVWSSGSDEECGGGARYRSETIVEI